MPESSPPPSLGLCIGVGCAIGGSFGVTLGAVIGNVGLGVAMGPGFGASLGAAVGIWLQSNQRQPFTCAHCSNSTRGLPTNTCPECGNHTAESDTEPNARTDDT